jgi:hypothetical protein
MSLEHWTTNEGLLAGYVLDRLSDAERKTCDRHLASCQDCRRRLEDERLLAAGVRRAGRDELKSRLRQRLRVTGEQESAERLGMVGETAMAARASRPAAPPYAGEPPAAQLRRNRGRSWIYAAATAACVVIVTGVGILNRWWTHDEVITESPKQEIAVATPPASSTGTDPREASSAGENGQRLATREATSPPAAERQSLPSTGPMLSKTGPVTGDGAMRDEVREAKAPAFEAQGEKAHINEERLREKDEAFPAPLTAGAIGDDGEWIEGETAAIRMDKGANAPHTDAVTNARKMTDREGYGHAPRRIDAVVYQRPLAEAPVLRQSQRRQQAQTVLANLQQTDSTLRVTLYPDPQLNDRDLRQARVYQLAPDTIVVVLPGQTIRYRTQSQAAVPVR